MTVPGHIISSVSGILGLSCLSTLNSFTLLNLGRIIKLHLAPQASTLIILSILPGILEGDYLLLRLVLSTY